MERPEQRENDTAIGYRNVDEDADHDERGSQGPGTGEPPADEERSSDDPGGGDAG
jgi:hypothetical protein